MKINVDRLCELAGLGSSSSDLLSEASNRSYHDDPSLSKERDIQFGKNQLSEGEHEDEDKDDKVDEDLDEMIEVDEVILVQELRRARNLVAEAKNQSQSLKESELKSIIESEVSDIMDELNLTGGWVYGNKRPRAKGMSTRDPSSRELGLSKN